MFFNKNLKSLCVARKTPTDFPSTRPGPPWIHTVSYSMNTGSCFPGSKRSGSKADKSPPSISRLRIREDVTELLHMPSWR